MVAPLDVVKIRHGSPLAGGAAALMSDGALPPARPPGSNSNSARILLVLTISACPAGVLAAVVADLIFPQRCAVHEHASRIPKYLR